MKFIVTGAAGFIGSHLSEKLVSLGHEVVGVDCFTDYYPRSRKEKNLEKLRPQGNSPNSKFSFIEADLLEMDLISLLEGVDYVFHQAAQAGVRPSWGDNFKVYVRQNIQATQRFLEAAAESSIKKFVYASSSSVYGDQEVMPIKENIVLRPVSPYGVTKLAAENLCYLYWKNYGVPTVSLRYFTIFGPRQRPDMAFPRFIKAGLEGVPLTIFGDGKQTRDFTYIADAVAANLLAMESPPGEVYNIAGGMRITVNGVFAMLEQLLGKALQIEYISPPKGDMRHTWADISHVRKTLGYAPKVGLEEGLAQEIAWMESLERGLR